jgi:hypothetical protein
VFDIVFPEVNVEEVNGLWKDALKKQKDNKDKDRDDEDDD